MGHKEVPIISSRLERAVRLSAVLIPLVLAGYTILASFDFVPTSHLLPGASVLYTVAALLVASSLVPLAIPSLNSRSTLNGYLVWHHAFLAVFLLMISGLSSPVIFLWVPLAIIAATLIGQRAFAASIGSLVALAGIYASCSLTPLEEAAHSSVWVLIVACLSGLMASGMQRIDYDQREVDESHALIALQKNRTMTLINNLTDAIISTDDRGEILVYNAAVLNLLDTNAELEGASIDTVLKPVDTNNTPVMLSKLLHSTSTVKVRDDLTLTVDGEPLRIELTTSPIRDTYHGENDSEEVISGYILIVRDITTAKSLEEERDEFISVVSHELRTPITIAEGTLSNTQLMMQRNDIAHEKLVESVDMAHAQVVFLAKMVNDLSTLSRAERGVADQGEEIDVDAMIHDLYQEYEPQAAEKGLTLNLHVPGRAGTVFASRLYLKELLQNFVTNAIKYTREGSVTIDVKRSRDGHVTFAVKDTGIGISKADQKHIYEKFYRAEDYRTRESSGTGLGLYVSVKLAHKLGTKIEMKSRLNHGSVFSITLDSARAKR